MIQDPVQTVLASLSGNNLVFAEVALSGVFFFVLAQILIKLYRLVVKVDHDVIEEHKEGKL